MFDSSETAEAWRFRPVSGGSERGIEDAKRPRSKAGDWGPPECAAEICFRRACALGSAKDGGGLSCCSHTNFRSEREMMERERKNG